MGNGVHHRPGPSRRVGALDTGYTRPQLARTPGLAPQISGWSAPAPLTERIAASGDTMTEPQADFPEGSDQEHELVMPVAVSTYKQGDWSVELKGDHMDLGNVATAGSRSDYFRVWGGVDDWHDCPSDRYFFNTLYFEYARDEETIWQMTYELLDILNSTTEFFSLEAWKQSVVAIRHKDVPITFRPKAKVVALIGRPARMSYHKWRQHMDDALKSSPRLALLVLATEKEDIRTMLKYFSVPGSWSTYYKILETMETLARKNKGVSVPVSRAERSRFTNSANNFEVVGIDARHGMMPHGRENPVEPMTLEEGHAFITGFCKSYLNLVYPEYFKFS